MDIKKLKETIVRTLNKPLLTREIVIGACNAISMRILSGEYQELLKLSGFYELHGEEQLIEIAKMLNEDSLNQKIALELGKDCDRAFPWGVLFHIGAGNMDGLAAYSVIEGLLTGNINLVKLPSNDTGISALLLKELVKQEPVLAEYIYLFDVSSSQKELIRNLAAVADAVVVWGSDEAVSAIRGLVPPNCRLIEWGHKISFAYVTVKGINDKSLEQLAYHIMETKQLLCSSCQGVYLEGEDEAAVLSFGRHLLRIMETVFHTNQVYDMESIAQNSLKAYTYQLENRNRKIVLIEGHGVKLFYVSENQLEAAIGYGNVWIKMLNRADIIDVLKQNRGHLQTVGLICDETEREELTLKFLRAGVTTIRSVADMSKLYSEASHDGEYPLRRYTKIVDIR